VRFRISGYHRDGHQLGYSLVRVGIRDRLRVRFRFRFRVRVTE